MLALSLFTTVPVFCSAYTFFVNYLAELLTTIVRRHTAGAGICEPGYSKVRRTLNAILYCKDCKRLTRIFAGLPKGGFPVLARSSSQLAASDA